jgi:predicted dienelactone hydrolase
MITLQVNRILSVLLIAVLAVSALAISAPALAQGDNPPQGLRPDAPPYALHGPYAVGTRQFMIDSDSDSSLPLWAWYPAMNPDGQPESVIYTAQVKWEPAPDFATEFYGHALQDALPDMSGGPYPLLVFSPGYGTSSPFYSNMLEHLASYGFVVLSPDHREGVYLTSDNPMSDVPMSSIERPRDIHRVLDYAERLTATGGALEGVIDMEKVAVAGHSSGGYTALAAAGARFDISAFNLRCENARAEGDPNGWLCDPLEPFESDMAALAGLNPMPDGLWSSWGDSRVDAIITMAGDSYLFDQAGLAEITIPVLAMGGTADTGTPFEWGVGPTYTYVSSQHKALVTFENAEHGLFANGCESAPWLVDIGFWWMCIDPIWDKHRTNDLTNHFTTAFLLDVLKGDAEARAALASDAVQFPGITYETTGF